MTAKKKAKPLTEGKTKSQTKTIRSSSRPSSPPPAPQTKVKKGDKVTIKLVGFGLTSYEPGHVVEKVSKGKIYVDGIDYPYDETTGKGLSDLGLTQWLVLPHLGQDKPKTPQKPKKPFVSHGDEVSLKYDNSWQDAYVSMVDNEAGRVWLKDHLGDSDKTTFGPFNIMTGRALDEDDRWLARMTVVFDHGWESQHQEDLFLGEGDTL